MRKRSGLMTCKGLAGAVLLSALILQGASVQAAQTGGTVSAAEAGPETGGEAPGSFIDMSTSYPGVTVKAGSTISFSLDFASLTGESADVLLAAENLPDNWTGYFKGGSNEVTSVHVSGRTSEDASLGKGLASYSLTVPDDAKEGDYSFELAADPGTGEADRLSVKVTVNEEENGASTLTAEYPQQQGAAGTSFSFDTTIVNNRGTDGSFALSANAPAGWTVSFTPSGETAKVTTLDVDAGASSALKVSITPPETVEKGNYTINMSAISAQDTLSADLGVEITGSYGVSLSTPDGRLSFDAYANKETTITLTAQNTGNVDLENLNLTSKLPTDWEAEFSESTIGLIEAGASKEISVKIKPSANALTGDYINAFTISCDEVKSEADFRVSVKTPTTWGYAAIAVIAVLVLALFGIIRKFGRR